MHKNLEAWGEELSKRSNGRLKLAIFPAAQMGPMPRQYDLARTGVADIAFFLHGALPGRFPLTEISHLPYAFNRGEGAAAKALSTAEASGILTELRRQARRRARRHQAALFHRDADAEPVLQPAGGAESRRNARPAHAP